MISQYISNFYISIIGFIDVRVYSGSVLFILNITTVKFDFNKTCKEFLGILIHLLHCKFLNINKHTLFK